MGLPTPNLDDRTFQQLVDEAKRHVQRRCPTWTNHNVSDPGVTLIEAFAWMTDILIYRLNRVPDRHHVRFLELIGVELFPPAPARAGLSFRLSSHQPTPVRIPAGTVVSTRREPNDPAVTFHTSADLVIVPAVSTVVATVAAGGEFTERTATLGLGGFACFADPPRPGDVLCVGMDQPVGEHIVLLQFVCTVGGHGIDPRCPPLVWEAWTPNGWVACEVEKDHTRGLNASGAVELHVPGGHAMSVLGDRSAAWLRCRVVEREGVRAYRSAPVVVSVTAATVGATTSALNADAVGAEVVGESAGTAGQVFGVSRPPVLPEPGKDLVLEVGVAARECAPATDPGAWAGGGPTRAAEAEPGALRWQPWQHVRSFADSTPDSRHFTVESTTGELRFGPAVRQRDGTVRRYGAVPPRGSVLRLRGYLTGAGAQGNVAARALRVLRTSIPYVAAVYNRAAATGGVDGETVAEAKVRGPLELRGRDRAVTMEDFEQLTRRLAPEFARVRCVPVTAAQDAGAVRVLVVPAVSAAAGGALPLAGLRPDQAVRQRLVRELDRRRAVGARVSVEPPHYVGIRVDARVRSVPDVDHERLERDATAALYRYFNPLTGGPDGTGWPFGRPVQAGEVYAVLSRVPGVDLVEDAVLFRANPLQPGKLSEPQERIELEPTHLVFSVEHQVYVVADREGVPR